MKRALGVSLGALILMAGCARSVRMAVVPSSPAPCRDAGPTAPAQVLTWIGPAETREQRALDARCAEVGRPLLPPPAFAPVPPARRVLVATWNVHDGRGDIRGLVRALRRGSADGPAPDAVVILLQEVIRSLPAPPALPGGRLQVRATGVQDIPAIVSELGWHFAYLPGRRNRLRPMGAAAADRGVAILSSLPISDLEAIELPVERQRRVALAGVVHGTATGGRAWRLRVVSAHLENRPGPRRLWARAAAARTRQAEALVDALALSPTDDAASLPMVVGGDFNVWLGLREDTLRQLRHAFGAFPAEDTRPTMVQNAWRLDYLFPRLPATMPTTHRRLDSAFGSDHYPVVATLDFGSD